MTTSPSILPHLVDNTTNTVSTAVDYITMITSLGRILSTPPHLQKRCPVQPSSYDKYNWISPFH